MEILQEITLDFARNTLPVTVFAKQYDQKTRYISITPLNNGASYTIESGVTARLQMTKPDGTTVINDATITNNVIKAELTAQALAVAGTAVAEIGLYRGNALLTSQTFYVDVVKASYSESALKSSDEYGALISATDNANRATTAANSAVTNANAAATKADTAATAANSAAESANLAKESANTAANNANTATTNADTAATNAQNAAASANLAETAANEAAEKANSAATGAAKVNISAEQTSTGATVTVTDREGVETSVHIDTLTAISTWADVRNAVRLGLGATLFPPGYEFEVNIPNSSNKIIFVVRGHDTIKPKNSRLTHSMVLETKFVFGNNGTSYSSVQFDAVEALYYAETALAPGTYTIYWNESYYLSAGDYQFTTTQEIPAGGQIVFNGSSVTTYSTVGGTTALETGISFISGSEGTALGTTGSGNLNSVQRACYGNNNYAQSAARQLINSSAASGAVWTPQNKFDRPPSWVSSYSGFLTQLDEEFLNVVETAIIPCRTNNVYEVESLDGKQFSLTSTYELYDKFFLLSRPEIFGDYDSTSVKDGVLLDYFNGLSASEKIKRDVNGTARVCWARSPFPYGAGSVRCLYSNGGLSNYYASSSYGVAPACIIA